MVNSSKNKTNTFYHNKEARHIFYFLFTATISVLLETWKFREYYLFFARPYNQYIAIVASYLTNICIMNCASIRASIFPNRFSSNINVYRTKFRNFCNYCPNALHLKKRNRPKRSHGFNKLVNWPGLSFLHIHLYVFFPFRPPISYSTVRCICRNMLRPITTVYIHYFHCASAMIVL